MADTKNENKPGFFKTVSAEFKKIVWPSKDSVFRQSVVVTLTAVILGILITIFDFFIQYGVNFIAQ